MTLFVKAVTKPNFAIDEASLIRSLKRLLDFSECRLIRFGNYHKIPGCQELLLECQIEAKDPREILECAGQKPVVLTDKWVIFDIKQGSVIGIDSISWLHLEVMT